MGQSLKCNAKQESKNTETNKKITKKGEHKKNLKPRSSFMSFSFFSAASGCVWLNGCCACCCCEGEIERARARLPPLSRSRCNRSRSRCSYQVQTKAQCQQMKQQKVRIPRLTKTADSIFFVKKANWTKDSSAWFMGQDSKRRWANQWRFIHVIRTEREQRLKKRVKKDAMPEKHGLNLHYISSSSSTLLTKNEANLTSWNGNNERQKHLWDNFALTRNQKRALAHKTSNSKRKPYLFQMPIEPSSLSPAASQFVVRAAVAVVACVLVEGKWVKED